MLDSGNLDYGYDRFYVLRRIITSWLCVLIGIYCPYCLRQNKIISQDKDYASNAGQNAYMITTTNLLYLSAYDRSYINVPYLMITIMWYDIKR